MIDRRLFKLVAKRPIFLLVAVRWLNLALSIFIWYGFASLVSEYFEMGSFFSLYFLWLGAFALILKALLHYISGYLTWYCASQMRLTLRQNVLQKALELQANQQLAPSVLAQYAVEGINQLELYYARFLPQLFYCLGSVVLIFGVLVGYAWQPAVLLLICMPLIPLVIVLVMKSAKKILGKYWHSYTDLGRVFEEDLRGLSTLKDFAQDEAKQQELKQNAESFRKATMSLLAMQLNSITIMDLISYCGAGLSISLALVAFSKGSLDLLGVLLFILLSAEFFLPLRQLGSFFHVALNGVSAMKRLFSFLEQENPVSGTQTLVQPLKQIKATLALEYAGSFKLQVNDFSEKQGGLIAFVGPSGSGKSTFAQILSAKKLDYQGNVSWNQTNLTSLSQQSLQENALYISEQGYLFKGSLCENLLLANPNASKQQLLSALAKVDLTALGLDYQLAENGANLSGGQRQRVLLARCLLSQAQLVVCDEITAGVDKPSEDIIMQNLHDLAKEKLVIFISHRLYNVLDAKTIYVFENGQITASGTSQSLLKDSRYFKEYFAKEQTLLEEGKNV
ncbi:ABC transporter ATP-binding protein/permease [Ligilactobacillus sp. Marseille-Q7487]|uniref:ABC transporter ATP-binding protein/permease n=1 Tax=Ligilactobacillus sp. Marseille-Q7487 TaxID=3022128 RepID=UPI0024A9DEA6|nr:ABC transporter ATP-binding protein/permease [Ligilactobacillus sp. Marseille-Q7487]